MEKYSQLLIRRGVSVWKRTKLCVCHSRFPFFLLSVIASSLFLPPFSACQARIPHCIFPAPPFIKVNEQVVALMNFTCNVQSRRDEIHRNNSASFFSQLEMTLLWLITFLFVQKPDRRLLSADICFTYLSNSDLWDLEMKRHKCKAISLPLLRRYKMHSSFA